MQFSTQVHTVTQLVSVGFGQLTNEASASQWITYQKSAVHHLKINPHIFLLYL